MAVLRPERRCFMRGKRSRLGTLPPLALQRKWGRYLGALSPAHICARGQLTASPAPREYPSSQGRTHFAPRSHRRRVRRAVDLAVAWVIRCGPGIAADRVTERVADLG